MIEEKDDVNDERDIRPAKEDGDESSEDKDQSRFDPSAEDEDLEKNQRVSDVINSSFGQKFTEDEIIHLAPADLKTGFYIDPKSIDKNGRFRYMFCMDMSGYDEVEMIRSIRNLMDSDLMTNPKDGSKREAQFFDFGAHVLRISRDQFEDIVTDPDKCKAWAASLGRTMDEMKNGFDGATNEPDTYKAEKYPTIKQVTPDSALEDDLSSDPSKSDVIKGIQVDDDVSESDFAVEGGL